MLFNKDLDDMLAESEEEAELPPEPELAPLVFGSVGDVSYWGFSQKGETHIDNGTPCQDRCIIDVVNNSPLIVAAIADGVGSCMLSHYGAARATQAAVDHLKKELTKDDISLDDAFAGDLLRSAMKCAYEAVRDEAEEMKQLEYSFQSTLTIAIYDGSTLYFSHAGDDGIVAILDDGTMDLVTVRKKGEEASSVMPLQSLDWETRKAINVNAFIMATDGVLDAFVRGEKEGNRIYYPFIEPAVKPGQSTDTEVKEVAEFYYNYMGSQKYRDIVTDDITMVAITNQSKIRENNLPEFDQEAWNEYSALREEQIKAALYPDKEDALSEMKEEITEYKTPYPDAGLSQPESQTEIKVPTFSRRQSELQVEKDTSKKESPEYEEDRSEKKRRRSYDYDMDEDRWEPGLDLLVLIFAVVVLILVLGLFLLH